VVSRGGKGVLEQWSLLTDDKESDHRYHREDYDSTCRGKQEIQG
jgi:hypothetical protein